jgi:hypothetical protein
MHVVSRFEQGLGHFAKLLSPLSIPVVCPRSLPHPGGNIILQELIGDDTVY